MPCTCKERLFLLNLGLELIDISADIDSRHGLDNDSDVLKQETK